MLWWLFIRYGNPQSQLLSLRLRLLDDSNLEFSDIREGLVNIPASVNNSSLLIYFICSKCPFTPFLSLKLLLCKRALTPFNNDIFSLVVRVFQTLIYSAYFSCCRINLCMCRGINWTTHMPLSEIMDHLVIVTLRLRQYLTPSITR